MTDQAVPESQVSMNWTMIDGLGGNVQVTMRATKLEEWSEVLKVREAFCNIVQQRGWTFPGAGRATGCAPSAAVAQPAQRAQPAPANIAPARPMPDWNGQAESFLATSLEASISKGKTYWKVKGGRFTQYGVTIWPEVLAETGLKPDPLGQPMNLTGWTAFYINNPEGKPDKVIKLTAPVAVQVAEPF